MGSWARCRCSCRSWIRNSYLHCIDGYWKRPWSRICFCFKQIYWRRQKEKSGQWFNSFNNNYCFNFHFDYNIPNDFFKADSHCNGCWWNNWLCFGVWYCNITGVHPDYSLQLSIWCLKR